MQAVWLQILDKGFMHAYEHGILVVCGDGITRRVFPRFFHYSSDYPERCVVGSTNPCSASDYALCRTLLVGIGQMAGCPCPLCYVKKSQLPEMGTIPDAKRTARLRKDTPARQNEVELAREMIYLDGESVKAQAVTALLEPTSTLPVQVCSAPLWGYSRGC